MKLKKINSEHLFYILLAFSFLTILLVGHFVISYYFNYINNQCIREPFVYGSKQIKDSTGIEFRGLGWLEVYWNDKPTIYFNTTNQYWNK